MDNKFLERNSQFCKSFDAISGSDFYKKLTPELGYQHKIGHIQKVMLFSQIIAQEENLDENEIKILLASASFHDSGRIRDRDNGEHGLYSAKIAGEYFKNNRDNPYGISQNEIGIVQVAIEYHVVAEEMQGKLNEVKLKELCYKYGVTIPENFETVKKVSAILKDADALDRARFSSNVSSRNSLNPSLLRTQTAKKQWIIEFSRRINQAYAGYVLSQNYPNEQVIENDNAKTLQLLRFNYKIKNGGMRKKEKDISVKTVKTLFNYVLVNKNSEDYCIESSRVDKSEYGNLEL